MRFNSLDLIQCWQTPSHQSELLKLEQRQTETK